MIVLVRHAMPAVDPAIAPAGWQLSPQSPGVAEHLARAAGRPLVIASHGMVMTVWLTARLGLAEPGAFWSGLRFPDSFSVDLDSRTVARL